jgi:hypothetical protein
MIAAAMLATPAMARESHVTSRHHAEHANASASPNARHIDGRVGIPAPRVGAFPPAPPDGENCDVGDYAEKLVKEAFNCKMPMA